MPGEGTAEHMLTNIGETLRVGKTSEEANQDFGNGKGERRVLRNGIRVDHRHGAHVVKADIAHGKGKGTLAVRSRVCAITDMEHLEELNCVGGGDGAV